MALLSGSVSVSRFDAAYRRDEIDFDKEAFREIAAGSEVREAIGFLPFEPGAEYQVAHDRWAFRVRIDRVKPDTALVKERVRELIRVEIESGGRINANKRKELRSLAEEELLQNARPQSQILEGVVEGKTVFVGSTANTVLGRVALLLRKAGITATFKTPWNDHGDPPIESAILTINDPAQSLHGSRFLQKLLGDADLHYEPADGYVKLQTRATRVVLSGKVLGDLTSYLEEHGDEGCEILAAKLNNGATTFRLDALAFRLAGLGLERGPAAHWSEQLDDRLERIQAVWELLDTKYTALRRKKSARVTRTGASPLSLVRGGAGNDGYGDDDEAES